MKNTLCALFAVLCSQFVFAQYDEALLKLGIEARADYQREYIDGSAIKDNSGFKGQYLNIRMDGRLSDKVTYSYRQRLNKSYAPSGPDGLPLAIDVAGVGIKATKGLSFFLGRQCVAYGGFEFDANPIDIYKYSELIDHQNIFMTGLTASYNFTPGQQMVFQVLAPISRW